MSLVINSASAQSWQLSLQKYTSFAAICLIPAIYFSAFLTLVVSTLVVIGWLVLGGHRSLPEVLRRCPLTVWALLVLLGFIIGCGYADVPATEAFSMLKKYRKLFYILILLPCFAYEQHRVWAWKAFIAASLVALSVSYLMDWGIIGLNKHGDPSFKSRITHGIFIGFFAFYCLHRFQAASRYSLLFLMGFGISFYNLFFVVQGRTGQLIIVALIILFGVQRLAKKHRVGLVLLLALFLTLFANFSEKANRISDGFNNTQDYFNSGAESLDSMSQRYNFWKNSLKLLGERPWFGHGTGSFARAYERVAQGEPILTANPHNEFLMIGVQLGGFGLLLYVGFLMSILGTAQKLPEQERWLAQGLWGCLFISSLFNSPLFDLAEGFWFVTLIALCFASIKPQTTLC